MERRPPNTPGSEAAGDRTPDAPPRAAPPGRSTRGIAALGHELRTPLAAVLGAAELLEETPLSPRQRRYLEALRRGAECLAEWVDRVLELARGEAGRLEPERAPFALRPLVREVGELVSPLAQRSGLRLEVTVAPDVPDALRGDAARVRRVLLELLGNALKFTREGGITLHVERAEPPTTDGIGLVLAVADTGPGIDPRGVDALFEPFVQGDPEPAAPSEPPRRGPARGGSGLGLALARQLARSMGGDLVAEGRPEGGSTFRFTGRFELAAAEAACAAPPPDRRVAPASRPVPPPGPRAAASEPVRALHVLLVDDSPEGRMLVAGHLAATPHRVTEAADGASALAWLSADAFDVVLMDLELPDMDGAEAARAVRRLEAAEGRPPVTLVAVTAHALEADRHRALAAGCDAHLAKPFRRAALHALLDGIARERKPCASRGADAPDGPGARPGPVRVEPALRSLVGRYLAARRRDLAELETALAEGTEESWKRVRSLGHDMKGTGRGYGFAVLSEIGAALQDAARAADGERARREIDRLRTCLDRLQPRASAASAGPGRRGDVAR